MNMLNKDVRLVENVFSNALELAPTRDGFGNGVTEAGKNDKRVVVLCADLKESTRAEWFEKEFPDRYVEMGVAEQNMATVASGMASVGKIPFTASYAAFNPGRNYEQIRTTIALNNANVKVCGMHAGVSVGPDGATHQMLEDIGLMRMLPNMRVIAPCDSMEAKKAVIAASKVDGPVYLRFGRAKTPVLTTKDTPFEIGKANTFWESVDPVVSIITTGSLVHEALLAARALDAEGIGTIVLNLHTIKPLDTHALLSVAHRTGRVITLEEHQIAGGMGSAVAEFLSEKCPVTVTRLGMQDVFGESGEPNELIRHFGLDHVGVMDAVRACIRKR